MLRTIVPVLTLLTLTALTACSAPLENGVQSNESAQTDSAIDVAPASCSAIFKRMKDHDGHGPLSNDRAAAYALQRAVPPPPGGYRTPPPLDKVTRVSYGYECKVKRATDPTTRKPVKASGTACVIDVDYEKQKDQQVVAYGVDVESTLSGSTDFGTIQTPITTMLPFNDRLLGPRADTVENEGRRSTFRPERDEGLVGQMDQGLYYNKVPASLEITYAGRFTLELECTKVSD
jgi:hypothetical protein